MFIAALFIISSSWKQTKHPSTDEWINKLWYVHTMTHPTWMALKGIVPSFPKKPVSKDYILQKMTSLWLSGY